MSTTTAPRRWAGRAFLTALLAASGCGQPPPMVSMTPPGSGIDPLAIDTTDDGFKAQALGESAGSASAGAAEVDMDAPIHEATEPGQEAALENGLKYTTITPGKPDGAIARLGHSITVNYKGTLQDGTVFDSTDGKGPATFRLARGSLIDGWNEGIPGMRVGEKRKLMIPPDLGYGDRGSPPRIPPGAELTFEIELVDVK